VILESVNIKTCAFADLFADHPEHTEKIVRLHVENGGTPRYEKFRIICTEFLGIPYDDEKERELAEAFSALVMKKVIGCPFVPGAEEFLEKWSGAVPIYVVSGTPMDEMEKIVGARGLGWAFRGVYGSPVKKSDWTKKLLKENGLDPARCRFVGDAGADLKAARAAGVPFVGRVKAGEFDPFEGEGVFPRVPDLTGLAAVLGLE